jgi:hypothetical protein
MIFAIVVAILAYRKAKENGRSGLLWAALGAAVFVGTQLIVSVGAGMIMGLGVEFLGWSESMFDDTLYIGPMTVVAIGASIFTSWLLLRYLDKAPGQGASDHPHSPPPPPPVFNKDE